ncbi:MAG: Glu-tRNA(Gln) amidotransferase subunit GatD [Candidatus Hydrothermarchaeales archaeon]
MYKGKAQKLLKNIDVGDRIIVKKDDKSYEGILMPRTELGDDEHIVIKLDNGYNIGIDYSRIDIKRIKKGAKIEIKSTPIDIAYDKKKPDITIMGTGGTIASKVDYKTGAVHPSFSTEDLLNAVPELAKIANIKTKVLFNILSENMNPSYWIKIAHESANELNSGTDGVVIAHGTDTMGYTAAALSFMLKGLGKPVVLVGSQRSSDRPSSDSVLNLISAVRVATSDIAEVVVVMHSSSSDGTCDIHRGTKVRKMHSSRRDAFRSINTIPLGRVGEKIEVFQDYNKRSDNKVKSDDKFEDKVALVKIYPGIKPGVLDFFISNNKGIVLEGTGLGHVPEELLNSIQRAKEVGKPVVMATQTLHGTVDMKVYSTGRELLERGVISARDMLPETAYIKLMHVLGQTTDYEKVKKLMQTNIAGEFSGTTRVDTFPI